MAPPGNNKNIPLESAVRAADYAEAMLDHHCFHSLKAVVKMLLVNWKQPKLTNIDLKR